MKKNDIVQVTRLKQGGQLLMFLDNQLIDEEKIIDKQVSISSAIQCSENHFA